MAFTQSDLTKLAAKVIAAGVISSENNKQWFEAALPNNTVVDSESVWSELPLLKNLPAQRSTEAAANAAVNPDLIQAYGYDANGAIDDTTAVQLTHVTGSNGHDWLITSTHGDLTTPIRNIISPTQVPRPNGLPSSGYTVRLFRGLPSLGNEITTSHGFDGNEVGWFFSSANSLAMFSDDDKPAAGDAIYAIFFQYVGATGGGITGDTLELTSTDGNWRIKVSDNGAYLQLQREDLQADGVSTEWNSYAEVGASLTTDGLILTRPYRITYDVNNEDTLPPDIVSVIAMTGVDQQIAIGSPRQETVINTAAGSEIKRVQTLSGLRVVNNRPLADIDIILDTTDNPLAGSVPEISWVSNINFSQGSMSHIRFTELGFETTDLHGATEAVPIRISVENLDGSLIQDNVSVQGLDAGVNNGFALEVGKDMHQITPAYEERQNANTITRIRPKKGSRVTLKGGFYDYVDTLDNNTVKQQLVPWQQSAIEFYQHSSILDTSNVVEELRSTTNVHLGSGISSFLSNPATGNTEGPWNLAGTGQHVDTRNTYLGNFFDRTYINSGVGGLWSLREVGSQVDVWSELDRVRIVETEAAVEWVETTELVIPLRGIFESALDDNASDVFNLYQVLPLLYYEDDNPPNEDGTQNYRISITEDSEDLVLAENQTEFSFLDGNTATGDNDFNYTIPSVPVQTDPLGQIVPVYYPLQIPTRSFSVNRSTNRTVRVSFQKPVRIYGYGQIVGGVPDPVFRQSVKGRGIYLVEDQLVTGSTIEERVDEVVGDREWEEANLRDLNTLHITPSRMVLADKDGEWLEFGGTVKLDTDQLQILFGDNMEARYTPDPPVQNQDSWYSPPPLVVRLDNATITTGFNIALIPPTLPTLWRGTRFEVFIDCGVFANSFRMEVDVERNLSGYCIFTKDRTGSFNYRMIPYTEALASTKVPNDPNLIIPNV